MFLQDQENVLNPLSNKLSIFIKLIRANKPIGSYLLLWPCLIALWSASYASFPPVKTIMVFIFGVFVMRSAGCVINDIADVEIDRHVKRTESRPLTSGVMSVPQAYGIFVSLIFIAALLTLFLKPGTLLLSIISLCLAIIYPFSKRWTNYPQVFLGMAFSSSIFMAYYEINMVVPLSSFILWFGCVCWIVAYDTIYAMVDREDDLRIKVKSTAITFGSRDIVALNTLYVFFFISMVIFGVVVGFSAIYYIFLFLSALYLIINICPNYSSRNRDRCFKGFLQNNMVGALIFIGIFLDTALKITLG